MDFQPKARWHSSDLEPESHKASVSASTVRATSVNSLHGLLHGMTPDNKSVAATLISCYLLQWVLQLAFLLAYLQVMYPLWLSLENILLCLHMDSFGPGGWQEKLRRMFGDLSLGHLCSDKQPPRDVYLSPTRWIICSSLFSHFKRTFKKTILGGCQLLILTVHQIASLLNRKTNRWRR